MSSGTRAWTSGSNVRTVPSSQALPAMTFRAVPPWNCPTVTTTGSNGDTCRLTTVCSCSTMAAPATTASAPRWGSAPWAEVPVTSTRHQSAFAMRAPGSTETVPLGSSLQMWQPHAASTPSHTPASTSMRAPWEHSSAGWNTRRTSPARRSRLAWSTVAAPRSMAAWQSWPQACMRPGESEENGSPVSSATGSASMSARSSTRLRAVPSCP